MLGNAARSRKRNLGMLSSSLGQFRGSCGPPRATSDRGRRPVPALGLPIDRVFYV